MALHWPTRGVCRSAIEPTTTSRSPKVHPAGLEHGVVLATVKVWPGDGGASLGVGATANLDGVCAHRRGPPCRNEQLRDARHRDT